jgi:hypothetical protein
MANGEWRMANGTPPGGCAATLPETGEGFEPLAPTEHPPLEGEGRAAGAGWGGVTE